MLRNPFHFGGSERFQGYVGVLVVDWDCEIVYTINLDFQKNAIEPQKMRNNREGGDEGTKTMPNYFLYFPWEPWDWYSYPHSVDF